MTCQPLNIDRLQLMAFSGGDAITLSAVASAASASSPLMGTPAQSRCAPAASTAQPLKHGALTAMIASRSSKGRFRSNESRKRFLAVHRQLASLLSSDPR